MEKLKKRKLPGLFIVSMAGGRCLARSIRGGGGSVPGLWKKTSYKTGRKTAAGLGKKERKIRVNTQGKLLLEEDS